MIQEEPPQSLVNGCKSPLRQGSKVSASDIVEEGGARENNIYVKNLPAEVDDAGLERMFNGHGTVLSCRVLYDHANRSKQVAFVQMETNEQATRSIEALHGTMEYGAQNGAGTKPLHVALAQNKQDRQRKARQASRAHAMSGDAGSDRSWQTFRTRAGRPGSASTPPLRQGHLQSTFNSYAGPFYPAGAGPISVAYFVPYTPASYATHAAPPGAFAYSGMPTPGPFLGMLPPTYGHTPAPVHHMVPVSQYPQPMPPPYLPQNVHAGPPMGPNPGGTWSPTGRGGGWGLPGGYIGKVAHAVAHADAAVPYAPQQVMMPMTPPVPNPQPWRM